MVKTFKFIFPHKIEDISNIVEFDINFERKQNIITFSLPFKMKLSLENVKIEEKESCYTLEFKNINDCLQFLKDPQLNVNDELDFEDLKTLEERMNKIIDK